MNFELLGHDCPSGIYPSPVVPIGRRDGGLYAAYRSEGRVSFVRLPDTFEFVRYSAFGYLSYEKVLADFDVQNSELFALNKSDVRSYLASDYLDFFSDLFQRRASYFISHEFRLLIYIQLGREEAALWKMREAVEAVASQYGPVLKAWYDCLVQRANSHGARRGLFPASPQAFLDQNLFANLLNPIAARELPLPIEGFTAVLDSFRTRQAPILHKPKRPRRHTYNLIYQFQGMSSSTEYSRVETIRQFVRLAASSSGRELLAFESSFDELGGFFIVSLTVTCNATGRASVQNLSRRIEAEYPDALVSAQRLQ